MKFFENPTDLNMDNIDDSLGLSITILMDDLETLKMIFKSC